jgi:putative transposase
MDFYHLVNRGVEKRDVVLDDADRVRFVHDLYTFNDKNTINPNHRFTENFKYHRNILVDIHAWCLMNNHYHLLVSEVLEGGVSLFMHKLNMGYAKYFNERYERSGYVWQGRFRKVHVSTGSHLMFLPYYIHLNPLDFSMPEWREGAVAKAEKALDFLSNYRWSSFYDYCGKRNFPSVIEKKYLCEILGSEVVQIQEIRSIIAGIQKEHSVFQGLSGDFE